MELRSIRIFMGDYYIRGRVARECRESATLLLEIYQDFSLGPKSKSPVPRDARWNVSYKSSSSLFYVRPR